MARVLVTGASGFIGRHVAQALLARGDTVVASGRDRDALARLDPRIERQPADLARDALAPLLRGCDAVVHAAAKSMPWGRAADFQQANVVATERLLDAARQAGVARFVHFGSPSIYFRFADRYDVGEDFQPPARWITDYARSKWESELRVRRAAAQGLPCVVLRPRAVFGDGDRAILPRLLAVARNGRFPLVHGGRAVIDITHVDNVVQATLACLRADAAGDGRAYNLSNGEPMAVRELLVRLFEACALDVRLLPLPRRLALALAGIAEGVARLRPGQPEPRLTRYGVGVIGWSQTLDISRARRELGYRPTVSIAEGLQRFARQAHDDR
ncbi:NAD(P)-dependent oxidoreductase [Flavobacterium sp. MXW15]|uniref:NAD(P)-dependent oxidoreductase n=1 Tax=Xanthomonas chitinilytica TaxID=2989819 RepID=A0ABT3JT47_9XANT|nr:NAD(P)-dependent oxidoreductase [Xanthomonas sp. H13-6]MCW4454431.1 NAD(P)-dependent oxidoreductase [Flavobacterium sp. MXW15]MCW4471671.1 NAD(P)-dependent oxidoreductase [Xanthomonas sp. H13-6]